MTSISLIALLVCVLPLGYLFLLGLAKVPKIACEPAATGYGEPPCPWAQAPAQRPHWPRGTWDASQRFRRYLSAKGIKCRHLALLDSAFQAYLPSYSTLAMVGTICLMIQVLVNSLVGRIFLWDLVGAWGAVPGAPFVYPFIGLALENAPLIAYLAILSGPFFVLWRTWLALTARFGHKPVVWIRTAHGAQK